MTTVLLALLFAVALTLFFRKRGYFQLSNPPIFPIKFVQTGGAFLVYTVVTLLYVPLVLNLAKVVPPGWLNLLYLFVVFLCLVGYLFLLKKEAVYALFWGGALAESELFWRATKMGVFTWFLAYPYVLFVNGVIKLALHDKQTDQVAVEFLKSVKGKPFLLICTLLFVIVIVPWIEELLFRGFMQTWLRRFCNRFWAILVSSFFFAFVHYAPGQNNVEIVISLFVLALFLGICCWCNSGRLREDGVDC